MAFAIKRVHNLPPHLNYVSTLPHITQQEAQLSLTNRAMPVCKFVEVVQEFL